MLELQKILGYKIMSSTELIGELQKAIESDDLEQITKLINEGPNTEHHNYHPPSILDGLSTLLSDYILSGNKDVVSWLIENKPEVLNKSHYYAAGQSGDLNIAKLFQRDYISKDGSKTSHVLTESFFQGAVTSGHTHILEYFAKYLDKRSLILPSQKSLRTEVLRLLDTDKADQQHFYYATSVGNIDAISYYVRKGCNVKPSSSNPLEIGLCESGRGLSQEQHDQITLKLLSLGGEIPKPITRWTTLKDNITYILNSGTKVEGIIAALNVLSFIHDNPSQHSVVETDNGDVLEDDLLRSLKERVANYLLESLNSFDPDDEKDNITKKFENKCIGDLDDYIYYLRTIPARIDEYSNKLSTPYKKLPGMLEKIKKPSEDLADKLDKYKKDLIRDQIIFNTNEQASEAQQKLYTMLIGAYQHTKQPIARERTMLTQFTELIDERELGIPWLKIADIQNAAKVGKQTVTTIQNREKLNQEFKQKWTDKEKARAESPRKPER